MIINPSLNIAKIAFRNFIRNFSRYRLLLVALVSAVFIQIIILGTILGMTETLRDKAARYFGGEIVFVGYGPGSFSTIPEPEEVIQAIEDSSISYDLIAKRSTYFGREAKLFFAGNSQNLRRVIGVNWEVEANLLASFDFEDGTVPTADQTDGILISNYTASSLGARVGDSISVFIPTTTGQQNSKNLLITGIYDDPSFFGFTAYMDFTLLNELLGDEPDKVSEIGLFIPYLQDETATATRVLEELANDFPVYDVFRSQDQRDQAFRSRDQNERFYYGAITLDANLAEIKNLLDAMTIITAFLLVLFLMIVLVGVSNTYNMIVFERTKEIGTMRSLGLTKPGILKMFLFEASYLGLAGSILGFLFGLLGLIGVSTLDFSSQEAILIFLSQGKVNWNLSGPLVVLIVIVVVIASIIGALGSAKRASDLAPVDALRQE
jgi:putative ABC transport system permease protein